MALESYAGDVTAHLDWWAEIFLQQRALGVRHRCVTEHGPEPYQMYVTDKNSTAMSNEEKSSALWAVNAEVKALVVERFDALTSKGMF